MTRFANASFIVILLCVITNTVDVLRAAAVTYLPFVLLFLAGSPVSIMAKSRGEIGLFNLWTASPQEPRFESYALHYIPLLVGAVLLFIRIGRRVDEKTMWRKVTIVFAAQTGLAAAAVEFMWNNVGEWSDEKKTIVVTVVVPLVVEVALTICRFTTRSLKLQHEASSWAFNGFIFCVKNVHTRLLITLIEDPLLAFVAALLPIPNNYFNEDRDRYLYRAFWRLKGWYTSSVTPFEDPTQRTRNWTLRLRNLHVETTFDIICILVACFFVWSFDISIDGTTSPTAAQLLPTLGMQLVVECLQSLSTCLWYEVAVQQPAMSVPLVRMRGWSVIVTIMATTMWCSAVAEIAPRALGRIAGSTVGWVFLRSNVIEQICAPPVNEINCTSLCERFPDAIFFSSYARCPGSG